MSEPHLVGGTIGRRRRAAQRSGGDDYHSKRREVIHVAASVFRAKGYQATTLNDIAGALATDRATLYYYVSGKEELLREAVFASVLDMVEGVRTIADSPDPARDKLRALVTGLMQAYEARYPHAYVFLQEKLGDVLWRDTDWAQQLAVAVGELQGRVVDIIEQGIAAGQLRADLPPELVANALFGMLNWTHRWFQPDAGNHDGTQIGDCFAAILLDGLTRDGTSD